MRILHKYVTKDFLVGFGMTLLVFTFVMCAAAIVKAIDLMSRGISGTAILKVFMFNMPYVLSFSIPMSVMTATLLLFSRLSFDGEITAMKACGLSIWQIISPVVMLSVLLSVLCLYLNSSVAPNSRYARGVVLNSVGVEDPINLLDEGRFVRDFPGLMIYVGKKRRNKVKDIVVYETGPGGVKQHVRAAHGEIHALDGEGQLLIDLYDVRIDRPDKDDPLDPSKVRTLTAERYPVTLDVAELMNKGSVRKKTKDMTVRELLAVVRDPRSVYPGSDEKMVVKQRMKKLVALNKRFTLSVSCFAFGLLAIPLGMKSRRRESSAGIAISLVVVFAFYGFIVFAEAMSSRWTWRPDLLIWVPVIAAEVAGLMMIRRLDRT